MAELGLTRDRFRSPEVFRAALPDEWLQTIDLDSQAAWITSLVDALGWERVADRPMGLTAIEGWLGLTLGYCADPPGFRRALPEWFHELLPTTQARTISRLANARKHLPAGMRAEAHNVFEGWLEFGGDKVWPYQGGPAFRDALPGWFHSLPRASQAQVLEPLARSLLWSSVRGPTCAVAAIEGWLGLTPGSYRTADSLRAALPEWAVALGANDQAKLYEVLSAALGILEAKPATWLQRDATALEVLNGWLRLPYGTDHDAEEYSAGLTSVAPSLTKVERLTFLCHLANCLSEGPTGDCTNAVMILEGALELPPAWNDVAASPDKLFPEWFHRSDPDRQALSVAVLARVVAKSRRDGRPLAAMVVEGWLGLQADAYRSPDTFRLALPNVFWHLSVGKQSNLMRTLAAYAANAPGRRRDAGSIALAGWLGIPSQKGHGAPAMSLVLPPWFGSISRDEQASILSYLVEAREYLSCFLDRSARLSLIEEWLGIRPEAYRGAEIFRSSLPDWFWELNSDHKASLLTSLALHCCSVSVPVRGPAAAMTVFQSVLGRDPAEITNAPLVRSCEPVAGFELLTAWIEVASLTSGESFLTGCRAMASYFRHTPLDWFHSPADRSVFLLWTRPHRAVLFDRVLKRLVPEHVTGFPESDPGSWGLEAWGVPIDAPRLTELDLMWWGETFENPALIHRLVEVAAASNRLPEMPSGSPGQRPFAECPGVPSVEAGVDASDPAVTFGAVCHLGTRSVAGSGRYPRGQSTENHARAEALENTFRSFRGLEEVLPEPPAVWLRTHFDDQGTLYWWAVRKDSAGPYVVARGKSSAGAESALRLAVTRHDILVERAWAEYEGVAGVPASGSCATSGQFDAPTALQQFGGYLRHPDLVEALREPGSETQGQFELAFQSLREHRPRLASFGLDVLASLGRGGLNDRELVECAATWELAVEEWTAAPGATRLVRLESEIHAAFVQLVDALDQCLDLSPWWATAPEPAAWSDVDVVIQPQGPLWAVPLGWLNFGGQPLYRRVASTGCVASLSLRELARRNSAGKAHGEPRVLAARWLGADAWTRGVTGPVRLHDQLRQLAREYAWDLVELAGDPVATVPNLIARIIADKPRVVVFCGHGEEDEAAVLLADGPWRGGGVDLHAVDLLVLASCSVGRLRQDGRHDVEGLFAELAAHRGRCVVAARWPIPDTGAAEFAAELVRCYLARAVGHAGPLPPFARARAFNEARTKLLTEGRVAEHVVAAFDVYNLG